MLKEPTASPPPPPGFPTTPPADREHDDPRDVPELGPTAVESRSADGDDVLAAVRRVLEERDQARAEAARLRSELERLRPLLQRYTCPEVTPVHDSTCTALLGHEGPTAPTADGPGNDQQP